MVNSGFEGLDSDACEHWIRRVGVEADFVDLVSGSRPTANQCGASSGAPGLSVTFGSVLAVDRARYEPMANSANTQVKDGNQG